MTKRDKVTVDEVIGLIHTDKPTDSVEEVRKLRGRNERFIVDTAGTLIDMVTRDTFDYVSEVVDLLNQFQKENEQLKQYIYDNLDNDICDVCSYQYLEKSQMDKYYIAKCKKGYDNCSKGTVIHCKDFKFKELQKE